MSFDSTLSVFGLIATLDGVAGRKRLQKLVHLVQAGGEAPFRYRFILHFFGPFSRELASDLDFLCAAKWVDVEEPSEDQHNYVYSASSDATREPLNELLEQDRSAGDWTSLAETLNEHDTPILEALSTIVFLSKRDMEDVELRKEFGRIKPKLVRHFEEAVGVGEQLELLASQPLP